MQTPPITKDEFAELLPRICDQDTSLDPDNWTSDNPLWGSCAVVAIAAKRLFGGSLRRASLENHPRWAMMRSHYWNRFEDGDRDFTIWQFEGDPPEDLESIERTEAYALGNPKTMQRFKTFMRRLAREITGNPIFENAIYRRCYMLAMESMCQKMCFGCVVVHPRTGQIVGEGSNSTIGEMKQLCEPKCIRFGIQSRTESMVGACAHAEETAMWQVIHKGVPINECELYIAGVHNNSMPWMKNEVMHSCLRCSVQMHHAELCRIYVPVVDRWEGISTVEAIKTASDYALKLKCV